MRKVIYLAGGCFWGTEAYYKQLKGVIDTSVGYANGKLKNPSYNDVCSGKDNASEAVRICYDDSIISLTKLLEHLFRFIDPTSLNQQGNDIGIQYRTGIYYDDQNDLAVITDFIDQIKLNYKKAIVVEILPIYSYYLAEEYHQDYLTKNPTGYCHVDLNLVKDIEKK